MKRVLIILWLLSLASASPLIFPIAESGRGSLDVLAKLALLPTAALLLVTVGVLCRIDDSQARIGAVGLAAGALATLALEGIRLPGFWLGFHAGESAATHGSAIAQLVCCRAIAEIRHCRLGLSLLEWRQLWTDLRAGLWYVSSLGGSGVWHATGCWLHV